MKETKNKCICLLNNTAKQIRHKIMTNKIFMQRRKMKIVELNGKKNICNKNKNKRKTPAKFERGHVSREGDRM